MLLPITDSLVVQSDEALRLLRFQWVTLSRQPIRPAFARGRDLVVQFQPTRVLVDFTGLPSIGIADEIWLARHWLPVLLRQSLQQAALVFKSQLHLHNLHNQIALEALLWAGRRHMNLQFQVFDDAESALDWLTDSQEAARELQAEWLNSAPVVR